MRKEKKKVISYIVLIAFCLLVSVIVEIFVFNFKYCTNKSSIQDKNLQIEENLLTLHDIKKVDNKYQITGEDPYIKINYNHYCNNLRITINKKEEDSHIELQYENAQKENKTFMLSNIYKDESVLDIKDNLSKVKLVPQFIDNVEQDQLFTIKKIEVDNSFVINTYRIGALFVTLFLICNLLLFWRTLSDQLHITFLLIIMSIGIATALINPPYYSYDEREHFIRAYENANFDFELFEQKEIAWPDNIKGFLNKGNGVYISKSYQNIAERNNFMDKFGSSEFNNYKHYDSTAATYPFVPYLPGAVGILIGRLLNLSFAWRFYLGRITSLLGYAIVGCWCIKHIKIGKKTLFVCSLLPALFYVTTAYSADTYTLAFSFLFITMCINMMCQQEPVCMRQLITLFVSISIVIMCKITYAPLCVLIFMIPKEKYSTKIKNWASKISLILFSGVLTLLTFLYSNSKNFDQWQIPGVDVGGQIKYILTHPIAYIVLICDDIKNNILGYLSGVTTTMAYNNPLKPIWIIAFVLVLCILTLVDNESDQLILSVKNKLIIIFSVACSWGLVVTALYATFTPVGSSVVSGVQGRYWGPLIFPLLLLLKNNQIVCKTDEKKINLGLIVFVTLALLSVMWSILYNCCW